DPDRDAIGAAQPQQVIGDGAVALEPRDEPVARHRIEEAIRLERTHVRCGRVPREAEHQLEMGIGGRGAGVRAVNRADVDAFVHRLEQPRERFGFLALAFGASLVVRGELGAHRSRIGGVGVMLRYAARYLPSMAARIAGSATPDEYFSIASRATSRQTAQPTPWGSHAVGRPRASRAATKQSSLCLCTRLWP